MLISKIRKKKFIVGVIGLGYVGLPRSIQFCNKKIKVIGFDNDKDKINQLNKGKSYLTNVASKDIARNIRKKYFVPSYNFSEINKVDVIIICLPTPLKTNLTPELKYIKKTIKLIKKYLKKQQIICLESTSYPGTTHEEIVTKIEKKFSLGKNFFVGYSPERNDPGLKSIKISNITKLVSGYSKKCSVITNLLYKIIFTKTFLMESMRQTEMTKLYENIYRAVNISFVNEMKKVCLGMKLDINEIITAAKTKPFGFHAFYPGPGLGGHCIPIDPFYLTWKAKKFKINTEFINLAGKINRSLPNWTVNQLKKNLREARKIKSIKNKKFLILGIAYKKNINDCRESPAFEIIKILEKNKSFVDYSDPYIKQIPKLRKYKFKKKGIKLSPKVIRKYDAVILVTDHDKFNYKLLEKESKLIIDTRHIFNKKNKNVFYC